MTKARLYVEFSAQSRIIDSLFGMYVQMENGKQPPSPIAIVVFMAFAVEAYANSIGFRKVNFFSEIERLHWKKKINVLHSVAGKAPSWGSEPLQFASELFFVRDNIAHGKPERVYGEWLENVGAKRQSHDDLEPCWFRKVSLDWVKAARPRFHVLMTYLGSLYGLHHSDHLLMSEAGIETDHSA